MNLGLIALLLILAVIVGSIVTRKCAEFMIIASFIGLIFVSGGNFLTEYGTILQSTVCNNIWIIVVCGLFGSLTALLVESKGAFGFSELVSKLCKTERKTLLMSFVLGILIFIDDYLNVLAIGASMKGVYDKRKLPREAMAYMLDATGAPVCVLLPFSTWAVFYAGLFFEQEGVAALGYETGISAYMHAVPFAFYPIATLIIVFLFALGVMPKLGAMKKAYQRVAESGKLYSDASRKYNQDITISEDGKILDFLIPMAALVAVAIITGDLLMAIFVALIVCFVLYIPRKVISFDEFFNLIVKGFCDMVPVLILLAIAFTFGGITESMGLTDYVISLVSPFATAKIFPVVCFIMVSALTFVTGNLWGMSAIVAPIVFPLGATLGANPLLIMAAIISGGAFGSHACFYTDATLLAASSSGIDNIEHAVSQLPYVILGAVISVIGFSVCGYVM